MRRSKKTLLLATAGLAITLAVLGGAYASTRSGGVNHTNGSTGVAPASPTIVAGTAAGMPPTAQVFWAVVNADGTLDRSFPKAPVVTTTHIAPGAYAVHFGHDLTGCAYTATLGNPGAGNPLPGFIVTAARAGDPNGAFVNTFDTGGTTVDRSFHLNVAC